MVSRRKFTSEFKSRVALEALREERTLPELAQKYDIHPNLIRTWKKVAIKGMSRLFSDKNDQSSVSNEAEIKELHA